MLLNQNSINERATNKVSNTPWGLKSALLFICANALAKLGDLSPLTTTIRVIQLFSSKLQTPNFRMGGAVFCCFSCHFTTNLQQLRIWAFFSVLRNPWRLLQCFQMRATTSNPRAKIKTKKTPWNHKIFFNPMQFLQLPCFSAFSQIT